MANSFELVKAGDIITSNLFNDLLLKIEQMDERIAMLEGRDFGEGDVLIIGFEPSNVVQIGQVLTIVGINFAFPPTNNTVIVSRRANVAHNVKVTEFRPDSTSARLKFIVPDVPNLTAEELVVVSVSNDKGSYLRDDYKIAPAAVVIGDPPQIDSVRRVNGSTNLRIGDVAIIRGANFSDDPTENTIRFIVQLTGPDVIYPRAGEPLQINSTATDEINLVVPEIDEVPTLGAGGINVIMEITVDAHPPATKVVNIRRSS